MRRLVDGVIIMVILTAAALCVSVYFRAKSELADAAVKHEAASARVDELKIEVERREREVAELKTNKEAMKKMAREKFGFIGKDDVVIKLPGEQTEAANARAEVATPVAARKSLNEM